MTTESELVILACTLLFLAGDRPDLDDRLQEIIEDPEAARGAPERAEALTRLRARLVATGTRITEMIAVIDGLPAVVVG